MKKGLFFATVLIALYSCSDNDYVGDKSLLPTSENLQGAITFGTGVNATTRAAGDPKTGADAATLLNNEFVFAGTKGTSATTFVFDQYTAKFDNNTAGSTESNSSNWEYVSNTPATTTSLVPKTTKQTIKYWDYSTKQYDFAAYSLGTVASKATPSAIAAGTKSYTLQGTAEQLKACYISDLVTAYNRDGVSDYGKAVQFSFRSLGAKIRLAFYETVPGYSVKGIQFYNVASDGSASTTPTLFTSSKVLPSGSGTMTITFPTTGWDNKAATDYNKAHVAFAATNASTDLSNTLIFDKLADYASKEINETATDDPAVGWIGRASNTATYAGGLVSGAGKYYTILPYETGANLQLRIKYTLVSTDGSGETIDVDNATAVIPAELARWNANYAYTYIFKISDMTNGSTGVDGSGNIVTGLTPITLNAVVVDSEDGVQETITTVSEPSITTYAEGKVVTANDEYKKNVPIYVIVNNGTSNVTLTVGTNANLYTATVETGAAQTISEASVENALTNGVKDDTGTPITWTVTDANDKKLVVSSSNLLSAVTKIEAADSPTGNEINVVGAKFTPTAAGTYVFQYTKDAVDAVYTKITSGTALTKDKTYYKSASGDDPFVAGDSDTADDST